jgi:3alpha(or 20beta)-hydroxysteroid dehydrogenase
MTSAGGGSIINVSSIDGLYVAPGTGAYAASKFAVRGLTKTAALELGKFGIRVNAVCPEAGNPEMVQPFIEKMDPEELASSGPIPRPPLKRRPEMLDVANTIVFLASDESAFYSGADFVLDGGTTAGMNVKVPGV